MNKMYGKIAVAGLTSLLLCGTAACSASADKSEPKAEKPAQAVDMSPVAAVKKAADNGKKITSMSYTMKGQVPGQGTFNGDAAMSLKPLAMRMTMDVEVAGEKQAIEVRLTSDGMYLNGGDEAAKEMDGKSWIKFPMEALGEGKDNPLGALAGQADQNPADQSASMTAAEDLEKVGEETVAGVRTTHYTGTATLDDMRAALKGTDAKTKERQEKGLKAYADMGIDKMTMDMWIDGSDHTKQFRMRSTTPSGPLDVTVVFGDYNKPVEITAPPAAETVDLAEMMEEDGAA
ncbi:DUF6612 family protein [Streptomyces hebeiensis]